MFAAEKPPPFHVSIQVALMAAEERPRPSSGSCAGETKSGGLGRQFFGTMQEVTDNEEDAYDDERQANHDEEVEGRGRPDAPGGRNSWIDRGS